jgi:hypothetical protein
MPQRLRSKVTEDARRQGKVIYPLDVDKQCKCRHNFPSICDNYFAVHKARHSDDSFNGFHRLPYHREQFHNARVYIRIKLKLNNNPALEKGWKVSEASEGREKCTATLGGNVP